MAASTPSMSAPRRKKNVRFADEASSSASQPSRIRSPPSIGQQRPSHSRSKRIKSEQTFHKDDAPNRVKPSTASATNKPNTPIKSILRRRKSLSPNQHSSSHKSTPHPSHQKEKTSEPTSQHHVASKHSSALNNKHGTPHHSKSQPQHMPSSHHRPREAMLMNPDIFKRRLPSNGKKLSRNSSKQRHDVFDTSESIRHVVAKMDPMVLAHDKHGMKLTEQMARIQQAERINDELAFYTSGVKSASPSKGKNNGKQPTSHAGRHTSSMTSSGTGKRKKGHSPGGLRKPLLQSAGPNGALYSVRASGKRQYYHKPPTKH